MNITIKNCNNIDEGNISIKENKLNIKFGINGTGKSTVAKAIEYSIDESKELSDLTPFKLLENNKEGLCSEVLGTDDIKSVLIFNEDYVNQFVFMQDELIQNSFDVFINTPLYQEKIKKIESIILETKQVFEDDQGLISVIEDLKELSSNFKVTKSGISKTSKGYKSFADGNKIENIPVGLESYSPFLKSDKCVGWLDWHNKGSDFLDISSDCPYCATPLIKEMVKIKKISEEYDKNNIKNLNSIIKVVERLSEYFSLDTLDNFTKITTQKDGLEEDQITFLCHIKDQIDNLVKKLEDIRFLSIDCFKDFEKVQEVLNPLKIDIGYYGLLESEKVKNIVGNLNTSLDSLLKRTGVLQGEINLQKEEVTNLVEKYQKKINQFLKNAGYKYEVVIDKDEYKLRLQHIDFSNFISNGDQHLSFGEKNAFALVLFMYEVLSKKPDLIILDDPISSFDSSKKYAIMDMLFRQKECLKNKTVLMLTHDIEPVIDTTKVLKQFKNLSVSSFLSLRDGILTEQDIEKKDILTFSQICEEVVESNEVDEIIQLIYLRRYYEIINDKGGAYEILSDLLHRRTRQEGDDLRVERGCSINEEDLESEITKIKKEIENFDYETILERIKDVQNIKDIYNSSENNYEKLQLFRILKGDYASDVMKKFINESYHIENEFINQLNPLKFDLVPEFIIKECDEIINQD
ncbi:MAG: AAA family ATPase [Patescibacteria group bacterium]|nr:AAA family ATPase [Patescibacteria group bacterium]